MRTNSLQKARLYHNPLHNKYVSEGIFHENGEPLVIEWGQITIPTLESLFLKILNL